MSSKERLSGTKKIDVSGGNYEVNTNEDFFVFNSTVDASSLSSASIVAYGGMAIGKDLIVGGSIIGSDSNYKIDAACDITLNSGSGSNCSIYLNANYNIELDSVNDVEISCDDIRINADDDFIVTADDLRFYSKEDFLVYSTDDIRMYSDDEITISAAHHIDLVSDGDIFIRPDPTGVLNLRNEIVVKSSEVNFEIEKAYFYGTGEYERASTLREASGIIPRLHIHETGNDQWTTLISKTSSIADDVYIAFVQIAEEGDNYFTRGRIRGSDSPTNPAFVAGGETVVAAADSGGSDVSVASDSDVVYASGNADFGEWVECGDLSEWPEYEKRNNKNISNQILIPEGTVVRIRNKKFYREGDGCKALITNSALVVGNEIDTSDEWYGAIISFAGQIKVYVEGDCKSGDYIVPKDDKVYCVAIDKDDISFGDYKNALGTVLEDSSEQSIKRVLCAIGIK